MASPTRRHLNHIAEHLDMSKWEVINLCKPGFRITEDSAAEMTKRIEELKAEEQFERVTVLVQFFDYSVFQVGCLGGKRQRLKADSHGT
jgi:hypothetical protein